MGASLSVISPVAGSDSIQPSTNDGRIRHGYAADDAAGDAVGKKILNCRLVADSAAGLNIESRFVPYAGRCRAVCLALRQGAIVTRPVQSVLFGFARK